MNDGPTRHANSRPALPGRDRVLSPALRELVCLLAKKAVEEHLHEAMEQQSLGARADGACPDLNEMTSAQAGQPVQEGRSDG